MSEENKMNAEEKAMKEKEQNKKAAETKESGELNPAEMKEVAGGDIWSSLGIKNTGGHRRRN